MCGSCIESGYQDLCHFDMYTHGGSSFFSSFFFVGRRSVSTQLPILCHALCRSPYQKDKLYRAIFRTKCVFIPWESPCSLVQLGLWAKDLINWLILFYPLDELCAKLLLVSTKWQQTECARKIYRSYPQNCYWVKCTLILGGVCLGGCVCVCVYPLGVSVVCATIRLNPQLSLTGLAEWTAEVYHCLLISSRFPSAHQGRTFCERPQWESRRRAGVNVSETLQSRCPSFCVMKSQISQSYLGQQMHLSLSPSEWKIQSDSISSGRLRDQSNRWISIRKWCWVTAAESLSTPWRSEQSLPVLCFWLYCKRCTLEWDLFVLS